MTNNRRLPRDEQACPCHTPAMGHTFTRDETLQCINGRCQQTWQAQQQQPTPCTYRAPADFAKIGSRGGLASAAAKRANQLPSGTGTTPSPSVSKPPDNPPNLTD